MESDGLMFLDTMLSLLEVDEFELVSLIARRVWLRRNSFVFKGRLTSPLQVFQLGQVALEDYRKSICSSDPQSEILITQRTTGWQKPVVGFVKTNWDATIDVGKNLMGLGVIMCDVGGYVVGVLCATVPFILDPAIAEVVALW